MEQSIEDLPTGPENIEEIVRETVDRLVTITLLNTAPFVVNMLTAVPGNGNNVESNTINKSKSDYLDLRNSIQQTSPMKQQQQPPQIHHPQLIIQPTTTNPTLFVTPRILNFQTVVPKPTTNIQIGNTKIILVSPSNITQHLPHSTTSIQPPSTTVTSQQQNNSVKLVKFTTTNNNNNNNSLITRPTTTLTNNPTQTSTLTLPKNVQIVIPSQTPSTIQLARTTHNEDSTKSFRPVTTTSMALKTCTVDQIPQAAQEITVSTSPTSSPPLAQSNSSDLGTIVNVISSNSNNQLSKSGASLPENNNPDLTIGKLRRRSSSSTLIEKPMGKILRLIAKVLPVYSPNNSNDG